MSGIVPIVSDIKQPRELAQIFDLFAQWLILSPLFRLMTPGQLEKFGIDDPAELELLKVKTQKEFAQRFTVSVDTLTNWKKREDFRELIVKYKKEWGRNKTPSVMAGFYRKTVSKADAHRVKLWYQLFEDFEEKSKVKIEGGSLIEMVRAATEVEVAEKKKLETAKKEPAEKDAK